MNSTFTLRRFVTAVTAVPALAILAACSLEKQELPSFVGPSEFGLSLTLSAVPDTVLRDGVSQSVVTITARNSEGRPASGQRLMLAVTPSYGGTISDREVVTGPDGRATVDFTAPTGETGLTAVSIQATPVGQNFSNAVPRSMTIGLLGPEGPVPATLGPLAPQITYSPTDPVPGTKILFDALSSQTSAGVRIIEYWWDYGDGNNGNGVVASHAYQLPYTYMVRLTVRDNYGRTATTTKEVTVGEAQ
jgi:hypothetical protein